MKKTFLAVGISLFLLLSAGLVSSVYAQGPPPPPPPPGGGSGTSAPIDGDVIILLLTAAVYGVYKLKKNAGSTHSLAG
jgi:hypothetical protein